jgi:hypothetical protein
VVEAGGGGGADADPARAALMAEINELPKGYVAFSLPVR